MNKRIMILCLVALSASSVSAQNQPACQVSAVSSEKIKEISDRYNKQFEELGAFTQKENEKIQSEGAREGSIVFDSHIGTRKAEFALHVPEVAMRDQKMSMHLPDISLKRQTWSYDSPTVVTGSDCRAGPDETVIEWKTCRSDFGNFDYPCSETRTRRGKDICLPTVKTEMRREELSLDVPEIKMTRKEWVMGVPETKMTLQKFSFDYPVLIIDRVEAKTEAQKRSAAKVQQSTSENTQRLSSALKSEVRSASMAPIEESYDCALKALNASEIDALDRITQMYAAYQAGYQKALESKSKEAIATFEQALKQLEDAKAKTRASFNEARSELNEKKRKELAKVTQA